MKLTKFFKTILISICLTVSFAIAGLSLTGCGDGNEPDKYAEIDKAINAAVDFLTNARDCGNYSSVSEYYDGRVYEYYADDGKIKCVYTETFYAVKEGGFDLYKISQDDDGTWHKNNDDTDLSDPEDRMTKLIINVNRTFIWNDYDRKTKTLKCVASDGTITVSLDEGVFTLAFNYDTGTTKHTITNVGSTTVTLPEDIIDDTEY